MFFKKIMFLALCLVLNTNSVNDSYLYYYHLYSLFSLPHLLWVKVYIKGTKTAYPMGLPRGLSNICESALLTVSTVHCP